MITTTTTSLNTLCKNLRLAYVIVAKNHIFVAICATPSAIPTSTNFSKTNQSVHLVPLIQQKLEIQNATYTAVNLLTLNANSAVLSLCGLLTEQLTFATSATKKQVIMWLDLAKVKIDVILVNCMKIILQMDLNMPLGAVLAE